MEEIRRRGYNIPVFYQSSDGDVREAIKFKNDANNPYLGGIYFVDDKTLS